MVEPEREIPPAAQIQSRPACLDTRPDRRALRPRPARAEAVRRPAHPRHRLRRRAAVRTDGAARRRGRRCRRFGHEHRGGEAPRRRIGRDGRLSRDDGRRPRRRRRDLRCDSQHGGGRARFRCRPVRVEMQPDGAAERRHVRRHHQPHAEGAGPRHYRRGICAALAAARHAPVRQAGASGRAGKGPVRRRHARHRADRRDLQPARRPLAEIHRHGRQLHGAGGTGGEPWPDRQFRSSGKVGIGRNSTPSSIRPLASSVVASP